MGAFRRLSASTPLELFKNLQKQYRKLPCVLFNIFCQCRDIPAVIWTHRDLTGWFLRLFVKFCKPLPLRWLNSCGTTDTQWKCSYEQKIQRYTDTIAIVNGECAQDYVSVDIPYHTPWLNTAPGLLTILTASVQ